MAGRVVFFGGRWKTPCPGRHDPIHVIATDEGGPSALAELIGADEIRLCERHYREVEAAGLVTEPGPFSREELERRRRSR